MGRDASCASNNTEAGSCKLSSSYANSFSRIFVLGRFLCI